MIRNVFSRRFWHFPLLTGILVVFRFEGHSLLGVVAVVVVLLGLVPVLLLARGQEGEDHELDGQDGRSAVEDDVPRAEAGLEKKKEWRLWSATSLL